MTEVENVITPRKLDESALAVTMLSALCEYFEGADYAEDALTIAWLTVCDDREDDDTARKLVMHMGYIASMILLPSWRIHHDTRVRAQQILDVALPGYGEPGPSDVATAAPE